MAARHVDVERTVAGRGRNKVIRLQAPRSRALIGYSAWRRAWVAHFKTLVGGQWLELDVRRELRSSEDAIEVYAYRKLIRIERSM